MLDIVACMFGGYSEIVVMRLTSSSLINLGIQLHSRGKFRHFEIIRLLLRPA